MPTDQMGTTQSRLRTGAGMAALLASGLLGTLGLFAIAVALPQMAQHYSDRPHGALLVQLVGAIVGFAFALGSPVVGRAIDRFGVRMVYLAGALTFAIAGTAPALIDDLFIILATRVVLGFAIAGVLVSGLTGIGALAESARARMLGFHSVVGGLTAVALFPLSGQIAQSGWRAPFYLHLAALLVIPLVFALPAHVNRAHEHAVAPVASAGSGLSVSPDLLLLAAFSGMVMFIGPMFSAFYLTGIGVTDTALIAVPPMFMSAFSLIASGGFGWLHRRMNTGAIFMLALLLAGAGLIAAGLAPSLAPFTLALCFVGAGCALISPNLTGAAIARARHGEAGRAVGLATAALFCAQVVFPFISQPIMRAAGPGMVFLGFGGAALLVGLGFAVKATQRRAAVT